MARFVVVCFLVLLALRVLPEANASSGTITNLNLLVKLSTTPGLDTIDVTGNYVLGSGNNGIHLPADSTVFSFDNGRFVQALPANSFTHITGGYRFLAPSSANGIGITQFKVMDNGTFLVTVRKSDFSGYRATAISSFSITIGDDIFTVVPNSIPVAKIVGPASGATGQLVTIDATQSTDFNMDALSHTFTIVSQPLNSSVSLSSTTNPTTSFTPTHRGAYVVKDVPSDGISEGVPSIFTFEATGAEDPLPPPGRENGIITLNSSQPSYIVGESAVLTAHEDVQTGNGSYRYYFNSTLDDVPITLLVVPGSNVDNVYTSPAFSSAGEHLFKVDLYIEETVLAQRLITAIADLNSDIVAINAALVNETEPDAIASLNAQKAFDLEQIGIAQARQALNRTKTGETTVLPFTVNE